MVRGGKDLKNPPTWWNLAGEQPWKMCLKWSSQALHKSELGMWYLNDKKPASENAVFWL